MKKLTLVFVLLVFIGCIKLPTPSNSSSVDKIYKADTSIVTELLEFQYMIGCTESQIRTKYLKYNQTPIQTAHTSAGLYCMTVETQMGTIVYYWEKDGNKACDFYVLFPIPDKATLDYIIKYNNKNYTILKSDRWQYFRADSSITNIKLTYKDWLYSITYIPLR